MTHLWTNTAENLVVAEYEDFITTDYRARHHNMICLDLCFHLSSNPNLLSAFWPALSRAVGGSSDALLLVGSMLGSQASVESSKSVSRTDLVLLITRFTNPYFLEVT